MEKIKKRMEVLRQQKGASEDRLEELQQSAKEFEEKANAVSRRQSLVCVWVVARLVYSVVHKLFYSE